ncbi:MAG: Smr/MutS family protein [Gammaproteobacteria bacterium]|nr:Smr/MutS family protein [Gammaproteobacteria bacterium]
MSGKYQDEENDEFKLFLEEMAETTRHRHDGIEPFRPRLRPLPRQPEAEKTDAGELELVDLNIETEDELAFVRPGVQKRLFQNLRRGQLTPQALLDLHGLRVVEARIELVRFLDYARRHRLRVVQIIHGKGYGSEGRQPILKQKVNQWLRQPEMVLAFCSAPHFDGGRGAVYVLLSRKAGSGD